MLNPLLVSKGLKQIKFILLSNSLCEVSLVALHCFTG